MHVLALDGIDERGLAILREAGLEVTAAGKMNEEELKDAIRDSEALIVRSATKVTAAAINAAKKLKIIGRAGVGTDNIDVTAATERGIVVVNAPEGNTVAAAEHTIAMMLALARNIPQANATLKQGIWEKKKYVGVELRGKTLGVIGLGKIGREVARRARGMEMKVMAYDPYVDPEQATRLEVELASLETVLQAADFVTVHLPLTNETRHLLGREELKLLKPGARVLNVARGGIIDEAALYEALKAGQVAGAALDVFEEEPLKASPLLELDNVIVTPHLGASTEEAQVAVAVEVARDVVRCLKGEPVLNAVNIPVVRGHVAEVLRPYLQLAEKLGSFLAQLMESPIIAAEICCNGELAQYDLAPLTSSFLKGLLRPLLADAVNYVNAPLVAKKRGIRIREKKSREMEYFANLISVKVEGRRESHRLAGTVNQAGEPRLVNLDGYSVDASPAGHMLVVPHLDRPRIIGPVGLAIGDHKVNIAAMQVGRQEIGGEAVMLISVDSEVPREALQAIRQVDGVLDVRYIYL
ncbi:phosphoglycerate dehydrogenase [Neomoorella mulderi]|uniref:D-3-phosphoglycerate dehydrogenase n=1 Tax=Moorella mulderi DSM 14980 TaxID=1122241 RepID=A0A151B1N1_9FIRM|nr:phosphoglycerate dehydrogenase [Moorella mulderi]KYH33786.1 D-3-phosphoglycerate dehydrogenase [Moorella mulderi DSM 14980]